MVKSQDVCGGRGRAPGTDIGKRRKRRARLARDKAVLPLTDQRNTRA